MAERTNYPRHIRTIYYADKKATKVVKQTTSSWSANAIQNALGHLQFNDYGAVLAEVVDMAHGHKLIGVLIAEIGSNEAKILYKDTIKRRVKE